jgi:adenylate kinase family enzyme
MVLIMGVAGSGKSLQGRLIAKELGYKWLSSGEFLRSRMVGAKRQAMLAGKLLADQDLIDIFDQEIENLDKNKSILDGFPRTLVQAQWLLKRHVEHKIHIDAVIYLKASKQAVKERLIKRGRQDDNGPAIEQRFNEYQKLTLPILELYKNANIAVYEVNAERSVEAIHQEIAQLLTKA